MNESGNDGWTPLYLAALLGCTEVARQLLAAGAIVNATNIFGWTPLVFPLRYGHVEAVKALAEAGADLNIMCNEGKTELNYAREAGRQNVADYLVGLEYKNVG